METFTLSKDLLNSLISYLGTKPYQETAQFIHEIQSECSKQLEEGEE